MLPQIKEFERSSTTVINAYVKPLTAGYLGGSKRASRRPAFDRRCRSCCRMAVSARPGPRRSFRFGSLNPGPVAGAVVAQRFARLLGLPEILAYDMGGHDGEGLSHSRRRPAADRRARGCALPALHQVERISRGHPGRQHDRDRRWRREHRSDQRARHRRRSGPRAPARTRVRRAMALAAREPTVSDADLVLGYLDADHFAGGTMRLDRAAAEKCNLIADRRTSSRLGTAGAAWTIHDVVNETMAAAVRMHVSERGGDPSPPSARGIWRRRPCARLQSCDKARYRSDTGSA